MARITYDSKPIILAALRHAPTTTIRLMERTGLHRATVIKRLGQMHKAREIHISGWKPHPNKGPAMAVYAVGDKPDVPCELRKLTKHEIYVRYRNRCAGTEREDRKKAKDRMRWWEGRAATKGDPLVAALFGRKV